MKSSIELEIRPDEPKNRWVSYFDLLGFKRLVIEKNWLAVFSTLQNAIEECEKRTGQLQHVEVTWFSDTFVFYTDDDSVPAFTEIESASRWFMYFLITGGTSIPVRGAMSCGELYCDKENDVLFGKALIEAYNYGEKQNWIGFALCPSAIMRMDELRMPAGGRLNYRYWPVPRKGNNHGLENKLPCLVFSENSNGEPKNPYLVKLKTLKDGLDNEIKAKYENAIQFIEKNQRPLPEDL